MNIGVIGAGYVGLVAGACFSESGNDVVCVDVDETKIACLNQGDVPIFEPGLKELIRQNREAGRLTFSTDIANTVKDAEVIFIAVGTPEDKDGSADLKYVLEVARSIGKHMNGYKVIVDKSTVPVGTADKVKAAIRSETQHDFDVVSNPEFLKEGSAIDDFLKPDRVVIGTDSQKSADIMCELYTPFVRTNNPLLVMDVKSAEVTKYAANALLAVKVSFMNEMSQLCERVGADVTEVRKGIGTDVRIGPHFLFPGAGYGGSCFPKDTRALIKTGEENDIAMRIVRAADEANEAQKRFLVAKVIEHYGSPDAVKGKCFSIWGLAFKPKTDDMREAASLTIIRELVKLGAKIKAYDPEAMEVAENLLAPLKDKIEFCQTSYQALEESDALIIVTEWNEFRTPNFKRINTLLSEPVIFDGRNLYSTKRMDERKFSYYSIGRTPVRQ